MRVNMTRSAVGIAVLALALAACGDSGTAVIDAAAPATETAATEAAPTETVVSLLLPETSFALATPQQAAAIIDDKAGSSGFILLDVRTPEEYAEGHIAGSTLVDFYTPAFADDIAALDRDAEYVVYCRSGNRSSQTVELMRQLGFTSVTDVAGGIVEWQAAGLPLER